MKQKTDVAIGVDVTDEGTHVVAMRMRPDGRNVVIYSQFHPLTLPERKPLTHEAIATVYWGATGQSLRPQDNALAHNFARAIEAAHGIK